MEMVDEWCCQVWDIADDAGGVDEGDLPFCGSADVDKGDQAALDQIKCVLRQ